MDRISQIKNELLMKEWAAMVRECRSSGLTVKNWCMNNGVIDCIPKGIKAKGSKAAEALSIVEEIFTLDKSFIEMQQEEIHTE